MSLSGAECGMIAGVSPIILGCIVAVIMLWYFDNDDNWPMGGDGERTTWYPLEGAR